MMIYRCELQWPNKRTFAIRGSDGQIAVHKMNIIHCCDTTNTTDMFLKVPIFLPFLSVETYCRTEVESPEELRLKDVIP